MGFSPNLIIKILNGFLLHIKEFKEKREDGQIKTANKNGNEKAMKPQTQLLKST
jgi:hypothetical protein